MQRVILERVILAGAAAFALLLAGEASAGHRLAVGMAAGYEVPPGYVAVPVYNRSTGGAGDMPDTSLRRVFREPIYTTPRGYRYAYVRGYTLRRIARHHPRPALKRVAVKKTAAAPRRHRTGCITDIGNGYYTLCR